MVPERGGPLAVGIHKGRCSGLPGERTVLGLRVLVVEVVEEGSRCGITSGDVNRSGEVPGLGVAVVLFIGVGAVYVDDHGYRAVIRTRRIRKGGTRVPTSQSTRRVGPVEGRVHRNQVGPVVV